MKQRGERIRLLEADLEAAGRTPAGKAELLATVERALRQKLGDLHEALHAESLRLPRGLPRSPS